LPRKKEVRIEKTRLVRILMKLANFSPVDIGSATPEQVVNRITLSTQVKPKSEENLLIIEAVPEVLEIKQEVFKKLS